MESQVIFRDKQELQSADLNNLQDFARDSMDHIVKDAIDPGKGYSGFAATKTAATEVTLSPGRLYAAGAVYARDDNAVIDLFNQLPLVTRKRVAIVAWGQEQETDVQPRDFLIDAQTGQTEPQSVAMESHRRAEISAVAGVEGPDPAYPPTDANVTVICYVLLDTNGVVSIEQWTATQLPNLRDVANRVTTLEGWRTNISGQVDTLRTDLSALAERMKMYALRSELIDLTAQLEELRRKVYEPASYYHYATNHFLDDTDTNDGATGYDAVVNEGIRFAQANSATSELALLNPSNVYVAVNSGFVLPKYSHSLRMDLTGYSGEERLSAYTYETTTMVQLTRTRRRVRYGPAFSVCTNAAWWRQGYYDPINRIFTTIAGGSFALVDPAQLPDWYNGRERQGNAHFIRLWAYWVDYYDEPYWAFVTNSSSVSGQQVAQTFLNSQDGWLTKIGLYFSRLANSGDVNVAICETAYGMPDLSKVVQRVTVPFASLKTGAISGGAALPSLVETPVVIPPTFLKAGKRYAVVVITAADHYVAMSNSDNAKVQGTFFASTDGAFFAGNLVEDMKMRLYYAKFERTRLSVELQPLQLAGGILNLDFLTEMIEPPSTAVTYEVQVNGAWVPLGAAPNGPNLTSLPAVLPLRVTLTGSTDLMPGLSLTGSQAIVSRPKTLFKWVSDLRTLGSPTDSIKVIVDLQAFDEADHDLTISLRTGVDQLGSESADSVSSITLPDGTIRRTAVFNVTAVSNYSVVIDGAAASASELFHVAELVEWAQGA